MDNMRGTEREKRNFVCKDVWPTAGRRIRARVYAICDD